MHIKCLENPVNAYKCPNEPRKITKNNTTLLLFYVDTRNFLKAIRGNGYRPVPKGGMFPIKTIMLVVRSSGLWEAWCPNLPQMGQNLYHGMLMPLHDSMPSFMNFRRVLDLLEFKNQASQCFLAINGALVFEIHSHFLHGTLACAQGHRFDFSTNLYALELVHVLQIWIMHIKCIENSVNA